MTINMTTRRGAARAKLLAFYFFLSLLFPLIPVLSQPTAATAILIHTPTFVMSFIPSLIIGAVLWTKLSRNLAGQNGAGVAFDSGASRARQRAILALVVTAMFAIAAGWQLSVYHKRALLHQYGQREDADVVRIYSSSCGKRSCNLDVEYRYTPRTRSDQSAPSEEGYGLLGSDADPNDPRLIDARIYHRVPIAYEMDDPSVSALNFDDSIFIIDHPKVYEKMAKIMGSIFVVLIGFVIIAFSSASWSPADDKCGNV